MILLIDNYDSFTYNLFHQLGHFDPDIHVVRNDAITIEEVRNLQPDAIVLSPGPGRPKEAGICLELIQQLHKEFLILGVCLGHQAIGEAFGAKIVRAKHIIHGKTSLLHFNQSGLFEGMDEDIRVMRYHSLVIDAKTLPKDLLIDATALDDGEIMAIHHRDFPVYGVQFHPESIGTEIGHKLIERFLHKISVS